MMSPTIPAETRDPRWGSIRGRGAGEGAGFQGKKIDGQFWFTRDKTVYVNHYYFYIDDADFGPLFLKVCSYAPWSTKLCLNGHEWAKRQLEKKGIAYEALDNGFLSCAEPEQLQQICDSLGPEDIERVFRKWLARVPLPLRREDREAGYDWNLSIWQMEVSLTQIFDRPLRGREFFEEIIRDNLDLGRPDRVQLVFDRVVTKKTPGEFLTRVIQDGVHPSLHISYKNFDLKREALFLPLYVALTGSQLFVRPIVGLADNGDFPKVLAPRAVCDPDNERDVFAYVYATYSIRYSCRVGVSLLPSSESIFVRAIKLFCRWTGRTAFPVTAVGVVHLTIMSSALMVLLWSLRAASPRLRLGLPPLAIFLFSDVSYVSYLNSFYMDVASMLFFLLTIVLAVAWSLRPNPLVAIAYGAAGALMGLSKTQHVISAFLLAALAAWFAVRAFRRGGRRIGWLWITATTSIVLAGLVTIKRTPSDYKAEPMYSMIFYRLLPDLPNKSEALRGLGLPGAYAVYSGTHAYKPGAPIAQNWWRADFTARLSYRRLAIYFLQNPLVTLHVIERAFKNDVPWIRPPGFGNYERRERLPPRTIAHRFELWSDLRSWLLLVFPMHIVLFYAIVGGASLLCVFRGSMAKRWPLYPMTLLLTAAGVVEFLLPILLDGTETSRHLFLFHVITEVLILCVCAALLAHRRPSSGLP